MEGAPAVSDSHIKESSVSSPSLEKGKYQGPRHNADINDSSDEDGNNNDESATISTAIIHASVNIAALALLAVVYFNAVLLAPYWRPLFWAAALALPLRALKNQLTDADQEPSSSSRGHASSASPQPTSSSLRMARAICWALLGDVALRILQRVGAPAAVTPGGEPGVMSLRGAVSAELRSIFRKKSDSPDKKDSNCCAPTSTIYLTMLFRVVLWFSIARTMSALSMSFYLNLGARLLQIFSTVLIYHLSKLTLARYSTGDSTAASVAVLLLAALNHTGSAICVLLGAAKAATKSFFMHTPQRANSVATTIVIVGTLLVVFSCTVMLVAKIIEEIGYLMASIAVTANSYFSDEMRQRAQQGLEKVYATAAEWVQSKMPESAASAIAATAVGSEGATDGSPDAGVITMTSSSATVYVLRFIETRLPKLSALVTALRSGSTPASPELLVSGIADELRDAATSLFTSLPSQTAALLTSISPSHVTNAAGDIFAFLISASIKISGFVQSAIDAILYFIFFIGALYFLVSQTSSNDNHSLVASLARVASAIDGEGELTRAFSRRLNAVIGCSLKLALFHTTLTWLTHAALGAPLIYIPMAAVATLSLIPLLSATYVPLLSALAMYLAGAGAFRALVLAAIHIVASAVVDSAFLAEIPDVDPFFSALSFILGLWAFGIEGLVLGPLLMTVLPTLATFLSSKRLASKMRRRRSRSA